MSKKLKSILMLCFCFLLFSVSSVSAKAAIKVSPETKHVNKGGSFTVTITSGGTDLRKATWHTTNAKIATVKKGTSTKTKITCKVTAVAKGDCTVYAELDKKRYKCKTYVDNPSMPSTLTVYVESPKTLSISGMTSTAKSAWAQQTGTSSILKIKKNSQTNSTITGLKDGTAKVYATVNGKQMVCTVTVKHTCSKHASWSVTKAATCSATGTRVKKCSVCGKVLDTETIAKTSHKYTYVTTKEATCEAAGTQVEECSVCHAKSGKTKSLPALGHNFQVISTQNPTCSQKGQTISQCSRCSKMKYEDIPAKGHQFNRTVSKAGINKDGAIIEQCRVCGFLKGNVIIPAISSIKLSTTSYTYNGKAKRPSIIIKDYNGNTIKSFKATYRNNRNPGNASVDVILEGNYGGVKTLNYKINLKGVGISKAKGGKKKMRVTLKSRVVACTGYEAWVCAKKGFGSGVKKAKVSKGKKTFTISKIKSKKKILYVKVRTYKTINGEKYVSKWSSVKKVKMK